MTLLTNDQANGGMGEDGVVRLGQHQRPPDPEIHRLRLLPGDRLVLATDGLWRQLSSSRLLDSRALTPSDACAWLCSDCKTDDEEASVVIVDFFDGDNAKADEVPLA